MVTLASKTTEKPVESTIVTLDNKTTEWPVESTVVATKLDFVIPTKSNPKLCQKGGMQNRTNKSKFEKTHDS